MSDQTHPDSPSGQPYSAPSELHFEPGYRPAVHETFTVLPPDYEPEPPAVPDAPAVPLTQAWGGNADPRNLSYGPHLPRVETRYEELNATSWSVHDGNEHLDGVPWWEATPPPRDHEHWAQTTGVINGSERVERCACGAIRSNISPRWVLLDAPRVAPQSYLPPPQPPAPKRSWFARLKFWTGRTR